MSGADRRDAARTAQRPSVMSDETFHEKALLFECEGEQLVGVLAEPLRASEIGVVIVVGGPQYRVGSHRQFVLLARHLARQDFSVLRFDHRGIGDSSGMQRSFEAISIDIRVAIDTVLRHDPRVKRVVLWGLCDAASAAMMYAHGDPRVAGLILANPWARGSETLAQTHLKHYYLQRLFSADFWMKVLRGRFSLHRVASELGSNIAQATGNVDVKTDDYRTRMTDGLHHFDGPVLVILSESDMTAQEFVLFMNASNPRRRLLTRDMLTRIDLRDADHTFSSVAARRRVEDETARWLRALSQAQDSA